MIAGSFTANKYILPFNQQFAGKNHSGTLLFNYVSATGFEGGYYLNNRLPLTGSDFLFSDPENDILVLLSGYIYNRDELYKKAGIKEGVPDPVLAAKMFLKEGPDFVKKLNGDFAIFICMPSRKHCFLYRDHAGIRPVVYVAEKGSLVFSTDIISLSMAFADKGTLQTEFLLNYFKCINMRLTPSAKVKKLGPGCFMSISPGKMSVTRYWNPADFKTDRHMDYDTMLSDLSFLLRDAVKIRCDKRFNAGAHVSGGIDSGVVSSLARREYNHQKEFAGFSWSPPEQYGPGENGDERDLVKLQCEKENIIPLFSAMTTGEFGKYVGRFTGNLGYFIEEKLMEQAVDKGVNLIFSGWGGDEFISTGDRGIDTDLLRAMRFKIYFRRNHVRPLKRFIKWFLQYTLYPALGVIDRRMARSFRDNSRYIKKPYNKNNRKVLHNFYFYMSRRRVHLGLFRFYHLQERCESWSMAGYRLGVEYRYPLLDRRIIEYMLRVPTVLLCHDKEFRPLLRMAGKDLLHEKVAYNTDKRDPVFFAFWDELLSTAAVSFMDETDKWEQNEAMHFVDFALLRKDIRKYREGGDCKTSKPLFRGLVYLKAVNEFTKQFAS